MSLSRSKCLILFFAIFSLFSCSSKSTKNYGFKTYGEIPADWDNENKDTVKQGGELVKVFIANYDEKRVIFILGLGKAKFLNMAKTKARVNGAAKFAFAIKGVTKRQLEIVEKKIDDKSSIQKIKKMIITHVAKDVNVSGMLTYKSKQKRVYGGLGGGFKVKLLIGMEYETFVKRRNQALDEINKKKIIQENKLKQIRIALNELD